MAVPDIIVEIRTGTDGDALRVTGATTKVVEIRDYTSVDDLDESIRDSLSVDANGAPYQATQFTA